MGRNEVRNGQESLSQHKSKKRRRKITRYVAALTTGAVIGCLPAALIDKGLTGNYIPPWLNGSTSYLPDDPCTQIKPFVADRSSRQKQLATACLQDEKQGKIVLIDFTGLNPLTEAKIARETQTIIREASGGVLTPNVIIIPASQEAKKDLEASSPMGTKDHCVAIPPVTSSPSAIAIKDMPTLSKDYPNAFAVSLSPQYACAPGIAYQGAFGIATVFTNKIGFGGKGIEAVTIHEASGHLFNLGHAGKVVFSADRLLPTTSNPNGEAIVLSGSKYSEYGNNLDPMGVTDESVVADIAQYPDMFTFNPVEEEIFQWPKALLHGDQVEKAQFIDNKWTKISVNEIRQGAFAMVPLKSPVTLQKVNGKGKTTFDTFDIMIAGPNPTRQGFMMEYLLYDSQNTHNTAWFERAVSIPLNQDYTIRIGNQRIQVRGNQKDFSIRTFFQK